MPRRLYAHKKTMIIETLSRKLLMAALVATMSASTSSFAQSAAPGKPSGSVSLQSVQAGFIGSASSGNGVLRYRGKSYEFTTKGAGVGGFGVSRLNASGTVYNLVSMADFEGAYAELRTGLALGDTGKGKLWLRNSKGVILRLSGNRTGLSLSTGVDAMVISFVR